MKKKLFVILGIAAIVAIGVLVFFIKSNKQTITSTDNFIYLGLFTKKIVEDDNYVFTNFNDYYDRFNSNVLTKNDFENNNYVLISMRYDSCSESDITPTSFSIKGNNIDVLVKYKASCGLCAAEHMYYLLKVDKSITSANVNINYKAINNPHCNSNVSYKPIIYLYPKEKTDVIVKMGHPEKITTTYPKYNNEWKVTAYPNGDLKDSNNTYYGLYWEGYNNLSSTFEDGFVVKGIDAIKFLEEKLTILGLNDKERNEFIIYWLPKLENNEYNLIRFETIESINKEMPLEISPNPDTLIRILMKFKNIDKEITIKNQILSTPKRDGFTVVEWGGSEIK